MQLVRVPPERFLKILHGVHYKILWQMIDFPSANGRSALSPYCFKLDNIPMNMKFLLVKKKSFQRKSKRSFLKIIRPKSKWWEAYAGGEGTTWSICPSFKTAADAVKVWGPFSDWLEWRAFQVPCWAVFVSFNFNHFNFFQCSLKREKTRK